LQRNSCIVLVPVGGMIEPGCEMALGELERRGYTVRRAFGYSAIDFGRSVLATEALAEGFKELMWIDSDINFHPDSVDKLRQQNLPIVCGIYPKKTGESFACDFLRTTEAYKVEFGPNGGLCEINYAGFGFVMTRRQVYETIANQWKLPECNRRFGKPVVPYFLPMLVPDEKEFWYLSEDYAFCERAKRCGYKIMADSSIMLHHVGNYGFSWQDVKFREQTKRVPEHGSMDYKQ
jgi:hypothetical protein